MAENVGQSFNGTQGNMCDAAVLGVNLYDKQQPQFQNLNAAYTKEWGTIFRKEIAEAAGLPDADERRAVPAEKRFSLIPFANTVCDNWLLLSGVITDIATKTGGSVEDLLNMAGRSNYPAAGAHKWSAVKALGSAGATFISENLDWLLNGGQGMNPEFPAVYTQAVAAYNAASVLFFNAKQDMPFDTTERVEKLNGVHTKLMAMLSDGKKINRRNKVLRSRFSYTNLLALVQGQGQSGIQFSFTEQGSALRISTATAVFVPGGKVFYCDKDNVMVCHLAAGTYQCTITAPGYDTFTTTVTIKAGVVSRKKIQLQKAAQAAIAV